MKSTFVIPTIVGTGGNGGGGGGSTPKAPTIVEYTNITGNSIDTSSDLQNKNLSSFDLVKVYKNGVLLRYGSSNDYTFNQKEILFEEDLISADIIAVEVYFL